MMIIFITSFTLALHSQKKKKKKKKKKIVILIIHFMVKFFHTWARSSFALPLDSTSCKELCASLIMPCLNAHNPS